MLFVVAKRIGVFSVGDLNDKYLKDSIIKGVDNSIVAHPYAVAVPA